MESLLKMDFSKCVKTYLVLPILLIGASGLIGLGSTSNYRNVVAAICFLPLGIAILLLFKKRKRSLAIMLLAISIIVPSGWNSYEFFRFYVRLFNQKIYFNELLIVILVILVLFDISIRNVSVSCVLNNARECIVPFFLWLTCLAIYSSIGILKHNMFINSDIRIVVYLLTFIIGLVYFKDLSMKNLINLLTICITCYSVLVIIIYIYKNSIFQGVYADTMFSNNTRVGFGNSTIYIISIPLILMWAYLSTQRLIFRMIYLTSILLQFAGVFISQTRIIIAGVLISFIFSIFVILFSQGFRKIFGQFLSIFIIVGVFYYLLFGSSGLLNTNMAEITLRFNEVIDEGFTHANLCRLYTNQIAYEALQSNIWGEGMGAELTLVNDRGTFLWLTPFIDNTIATIGVKMGYPGIVFFLLFYFSIIYKFIKEYKVSSGNYKLFLGVILFSLVFVTIQAVIFNSQVFYNASVITFLMLLLSVICNSNSNFNKSNELTMRGCND